MNIVSMKFNVIDWALETVSLIVASLIYNREGKINKMKYFRPCLSIDV